MEDNGRKVANVPTDIFTSIPTAHSQLSKSASSVATTTIGVTAI